MHNRKFGPSASLVAAVLFDIATLAIAIFTAAMLQRLWGGPPPPLPNLELAWTLFLFFCIAASLGLYPGYLLTPPEELKLLSWSTSLFFLIFASFVFLSHSTASFSRSTFLCSWILALGALPLSRMLVRRHLKQYFSWGYPCVVIGDAADVRRVLQHIEHKGRGKFWPLAATTTGNIEASRIGPVPVTSFGGLERLAIEHPNCHAILVPPQDMEFPKPEVLKWTNCHFKHVLVFSPGIQVFSLWLRGADIGEALFLKTHTKLLDSSRLRIKRILDVALCLLSGMVALPAIGLIALAIKLDSRGPIFFRQPRLGRHGHEFKILKFRTMHSDAQQRLQGLLDKEPGLASQWQANHKLDHDPRITRVGRWLRMTSLDELPQFFNVLGGTMSMVGPRPIVAEEIKKYGKEYDVYKRIRPGLTGLWQISGRNKTTYQRRVELDLYYIRNWSIWMDIWIICRTFREVTSCNGQ